ALSTLLEYVQVPSPFVGTETILGPQKFAGDWWITTPNAKPGESSSAPGNGNEPVGTAGLHPPFNMVSNYRDPGKVNVNTIASSEVWNGILGGTPGTNVPGTTFDKVVDSRRGYGNAGQGYTFDNTGKYPSIFSNPFRSAGAADMVPVPGNSRSTPAGLA